MKNAFRILVVFRVLFLLFLNTHSLIGADEIRNDFCYSKESLTNIFRIPFPDIGSKEVVLKPLEGGRSQSKVYHIAVENKNYVLRINDVSSKIKNQRELFVFREAASIGIAPHLYYASDDAQIIIMDYVQGLTLTSEQAKMKNNIFKLAHLLSKVHSLPTNPYKNKPIYERMIELYQSFKEKYILPPGLEDAVKVLSHLKKKHKSFRVSSTTIHGDLNPLNILQTDQGFILIDWSETGFEDPFYDLSCFALCHNYQEEDEEILLSHYLHKVPDQEQRKRYILNKRMDYVFFAIELFFQAHEQAKTAEIELLQGNDIKDWSYYISKFEKKDSILSPQFLYDFGCCSLNNFFNFRISFSKPSSAEEECL